MVRILALFAVLASPFLSFLSADAGCIWDPYGQPQIDAGCGWDPDGQCHS